jgi:hypothetical protein
MDDIEEIARAMFDSMPAYSTSGNLLWTWDCIDDTSKRYWRDLAQVAHDKVRQLTQERVAQVAREMLADRHAGD